VSGKEKESKRSEKREVETTMYQQPYGYAQGTLLPLQSSRSALICCRTGAPGLAPGLSAPTGLQTPLIPPNFNFNAPVIHFGQTLSGATTISTPQPSLAPVTPVARPAFIQELEAPRLPPSNEDQLHTIFIGNIPEDLSDQWMDRITRVSSLNLFNSHSNTVFSLLAS
jgi:hypothetical protein